MTFLDTVMKELGRSTKQNIHNTRSLIRAPQVCLRHLADGSFHGGRIHTHTHTHTHARTHTQQQPKVGLDFKTFERDRRKTGGFHSILRNQSNASLRTSVGILHLV